MFLDVMICVGFVNCHYGGRGIQELNLCARVMFEQDACYYLHAYLSMICKFGFHCPFD